MMVYNWLKSSQSWLYPPICSLCRWPARDGLLDLCADCRADLPLNRPCCPRCGLGLGRDPAGAPCGRCQREPPPFFRALAPWRYQPPLDYLLHRLKYAGDLSLARTLGLMLGEALLPLATEPPDLLLPVPLHPQRQRQRGFNQAWELARVLARQMALPARADGLLRSRDTPPQAGLQARERRRNLRGAFIAGAVVRDRRIALLDDVMTTGTTVREAAATLLAAGAGSVEVWVLARA